MMLVGAIAGFAFAAQYDASVLSALLMGGLAGMLMALIFAFYLVFKYQSIRVWFGFNHFGLISAFWVRTTSVWLYRVWLILIFHY